MTSRIVSPTRSGGKTTPSANGVHPHANGVYTNGVAKPDPWAYLADRPDILTYYQEEGIVPLDYEPPAETDDEFEEAAETSADIDKAEAEEEAKRKAHPSVWTKEVHAFSRNFLPGKKLPGTTLATTKEFWAFMTRDESDIFGHVLYLSRRALLHRQRRLARGHSILDGPPLVPCTDSQMYLATRVPTRSIQRSRRSLVAMGVVSVRVIKTRPSSAHAITHYCIEWPGFYAACLSAGLMADHFSPKVEVKRWLTKEQWDDPNFKKRKGDASWQKYMGFAYVAE